LCLGKTTFKPQPIPGDTRREQENQERQNEDRRKRTGTRGQLEKDKQNRTSKTGQLE
jgi:hypothetical protein